LRSNLFLIVFIAGGLGLVYAGGMPFWLWAVMSFAVVALRYVAQTDPFTEKLTVSDEGLTREHGSRMRKALVETVRWDDLSKVEVISREAGPRRQDLLFLLYGSNGEGVAVSAPLAEQHGLVPQLQRRLQGFRDDQLEQAKAATAKLRFTLWEKAAAAAA
jgi:hypothetical protein